MIRLLAYFYGAPLLVGVLAAWVLRARRNSRAASVNLVRWLFVVFPHLLVGAVVFRPIGPAFWLDLVRPSSVGRVALGAVLLLVVLRGLVEVVLVWLDWARREARAIPGDFLETAPWLGFEEACFVLRLRVLPRILIHKDLRTPLAVGGFRPRILFPARMVPPALRGPDGFWEGVPVVRHTPVELRVILAHELEHLRRRDPVRLRLLALAGVVLPWEWIINAPELRRSRLLQTLEHLGSGGMARRALAWVLALPFRALAYVSHYLGAPYRLGVGAERDAQEDRADLAAERVVPGGVEVARNLRVCGDGHRSVPVVEVPRERMFSEWRESAFVAVCVGLLMLAPGKAAWFYAWEGKMDTLMALPPGWSLAMEPAYGEATAGRIPGRGDESGRIVVDVKEVVPGHWPQLKGVGRVAVDQLPAEGEAILEWDVECPDQVLQPRAVHFSLASIALVESTDTTMGGLQAASSPPERLGPHRFRFRRKLNLADAVVVKPGWVYVDFYFQGSGRYIFTPPRLAFVLPDGTREAFPTL